MVRVGLLLAGALLTTACSEGDVAIETAAADSATFIVAATIGGADDDRPEYEFGAVTGLALLADGRVAVADRINHNVRVYSADGAHVMSIGRQGAGPGELTRPCCLAVDAAQRLWVRDGGNARYNIYALFDDSASFVTQVRMSHGDVNRAAPVTFDAAGNVVDIGFQQDPDGGPMRLARTHVDASGTVVTSVVMHTVPQDSTAMKAVRRDEPGGGYQIRYAHQPYGPTELAAHSPRGGYAHALSSRYAIDWRDERGELVRRITFPLTEGPALSERERGLADEQMMQQMEFIGVNRNQLGFDVPRAKQPLRGMFFDLDGRLWVELSVPDGADRQAHVYSTDGRLERTVSWPRTVDLSHGAVRGDTAWGVGRDALDVPSVVRLTLRTAD